MNKHNGHKVEGVETKSFHLNTNMWSPPFNFWPVKLLP